MLITVLSPAAIGIRGILRTCSDGTELAGALDGAKPSIGRRFRLRLSGGVHRWAWSTRHQASWQLAVLEVACTNHPLGTEPARGSDTLVDGPSARFLTSIHRFGLSTVWPTNG